MTKLLRNSLLLLPLIISLFAIHVYASPISTNPTNATNITGNFTPTSAINIPGTTIRKDESNGAQKLALKTKSNMPGSNKSYTPPKYSYFKVKVILLAVLGFGFIVMMWLFLIVRNSKEPKIKKVDFGVNSVALKPINENKKLCDFTAKHFNFLVFIITILLFGFSVRQLIIQATGLVISLMLLAITNVKLAKIDYLFYFLNTIEFLYVLIVLINNAAAPGITYW
ncbi:hypothetical protein EQG49_12420 [Periweissella cryptocerci]|uniref:Uncharacterized protein n=1 Tax=Periweissella cryptocerci TaxID=2506420 RepID=A0A4P6YWG5_9LACO|nr:hypothetical protein [Periweissella cryptocerci]QBO37202.1 hypothetical protein EQG49_12420 [Periweissella cryptocerci]